MDYQGRFNRGVVRTDRPPAAAIEKPPPALAGDDIMLGSPVGRVAGTACRLVCAGDDSAAGAAACGAPDCC